MYPLWTSSPILLFHMESADQRRSTFRVVGAASYDTMKRQTHHRVHLPLDVCAARLSYVKILDKMDLLRFRRH